MLTSLTLDKENISLKLALKTRHNKPWVNRVPSTNNKRKWIVDEALEEVMDVIERGTCSLRRASMS